MRVLAFLCICVCFCVSQAKAQTAVSVPSTDPYRNFVGTWTGMTRLGKDHLPNTLTLVITEVSNSNGMRFDYDFGTKGDEGYKHETTMVVLQPALSRMIVRRNSGAEVIYHTQGLRSFAEIGFGAFTAEVIWGKDAFGDKFTFGLQPNSLSYEWQTSRSESPYAAINKSVFKRIRNPSNAPNALTNKE